MLANLQPRPFPARERAAAHAADHKASIPVRDPDSPLSPPFWQKTRVRPLLLALNRHKGLGAGPDPTHSLVH